MYVLLEIQNLLNTSSPNLHSKIRRLSSYYCTFLDGKEYFDIASQCTQFSPDELFDSSMIDDSNYALSRKFMELITPDLLESVSIFSSKFSLSNDQVEQLNIVNDPQDKMPPVVSLLRSPSRPAFSRDKSILPNEEFELTKR